MSNVKPGDLAKITQDERNLSGMLVYVVSLPTSFDRHAPFIQAEWGLTWRVEALEERKVNSPLGEWPPDYLIHTGTIFLVADCALRRIEPPSETDDIFARQPIEGEKCPTP